MFRFVISDLTDVIESFSTLHKKKEYSYVFRCQINGSLKNCSTLFNVNYSSTGRKAVDVTILNASIKLGKALSDAMNGGRANLGGGKVSKAIT